jgi:hypothetical protein
MYTCTKVEHASAADRPSRVAIVRNAEAWAGSCRPDPGGRQRKGQLDAERMRKVLRGDEVHPLDDEAEEQKEPVASAHDAVSP